KEALGNTVNEFFGSRRLWLAQYISTPTVQRSWSTYWLWQYTDGRAGPTPHSIDGVGRCDINSYARSPEKWMAEGASGEPQAQPKPPRPQPPQPHQQIVEVTIAAPPGVTVKVRQVSLAAAPTHKPQRQSEAM